MYIIYEAKCVINNKSYIGLTKRTLKQRKYQHEWNATHGSHGHFHHALLKYGTDNWQWMILESNIEDGNLAKEREKYYINTFQTNKIGYNYTDGGDDFTSSEYQRSLQLKRVRDGTHPFLGGEIQRKSSKRRWEDGTNSLIGMNEKLIKEGTHVFLGDNNPQRKRKRSGILHHNQQKPWLNTNCDLVPWRIADQLYMWFCQNKDKKRGGGPYQMAKCFNISSSLQIMYYRYFKNGWIPQEDPEWVSFTQGA